MTSHPKSPRTTGNEAGAKGEISRTKALVTFGTWSHMEVGLYLDFRSMTLDLKAKTIQTSNNIVAGKETLIDLNATSPNTNRLAKTQRNMFISGALGLQAT